jgi:deazaflavin-dependent oxidoreductase (nitroreductase family)
VKQSTPHFIEPNLVERAVNRAYGWLTTRGIGPSYSWLLLTTGRKTGVVHSTPVNILAYDGKFYLVGTRGYTQWSRNAAVAGELTLKRRRKQITCRVFAVPEERKAELLKAYLTRFNWMVRRFFPVQSEAPVAAFAAVAARYPVFELLAPGLQSDFFSGLR